MPLFCINHVLIVHFITFFNEYLMYLVLRASYNYKIIYLSNIKEFLKYQM